MNERQREFLLKLADLCEEYGAEFSYKNDDDGIHIGADGKRVASNEVEIRRGNYANGQMQYEHPYQDGKRHGTRRGWYANGQLMYEGHYKYGKPHGLCRAWYEDGLPEYEWHYRDGNLVATDKEMKS